MTPTAVAALPLAPEEPVAASAAMREVLLAAAEVASAPTTVLLLGESGAGKEVVARYIHARSPRAGGAWVAVNCAALPADLLESALFGHERGAFTGASERRAGKFEQASGGTLLLDEVSELPLALQAKLLRALQEREVDRVGGQRPVPVDVRIVTTSNRDLATMVRQGSFRSDLYYRLNVFPIVIPPLRERREDVLPLAERLLARAATAIGRPVPALSAAACEALLRHPFPGNVRELLNLLERAAVRCHGGAVDPWHLGMPGAGLSLVAPDAAPPASAPFLPPGLPIELAALERLAIEEALRRVDGNRTHAARLLGIGLRTLRNKLRTWREEGLPCRTAAPAAGPILPGEAGAGCPPPAPELPLGAIAARARSSQEETA